ncbi:hypothetical protein ACGF13_26185 [Kitasatospora sp. NPDC048286]|uniref:hypothetical protein n=1 Tax=Kitasatospora sp. NPDC048286 TaxID=3364047 RepID=UPI00371D807D
MPEWTGGFAKATIVSAAVATALLGHATPSHAAPAAGQNAPVTAAYETHEPNALAQPLVEAD